MSRILALVAALSVADCFVGHVRGDDLPRHLLAEDESRAAILRHLDELTDLEFADTPLSDVVDYIKNKHEFEIQLDSKGLTDAAVDPSVAVTKSVKGISLRSALRLILEELDLTYLIQDEVLKITSKEKADEVLITQVYRLNGVVGERDRGRHTAQLIDLITSTIQPNSWEDNGGPGSIKSFRELLVVSQKLDVQEEIQALLVRLRLVLPRDNEAGAKDGANAEAEPEERDEAQIVIYQLSHLNPDEAKQAIMALVAPESWDGQGGTGSAYGVTFEPDAKDEKVAASQHANRLLAVRQTDDVHLQIRTLLRKLDKGPHIAGSNGGPMNVPSLGSFSGFLSPAEANNESSNGQRTGVVPAR